MKLLSSREAASYLHISVKALQALVHCRVGSLENWYLTSCRCIYVHCRIGSLESYTTTHLKTCEVHCRIDSLESPNSSEFPNCSVHCCIGGVISQPKKKKLS